MGRASRDGKDLLAAVAVEVVVVAAVGAFVARGLAGQLDGLHIAGIEQDLQVAVDSGNAQRGKSHLGEGEDLRGQQRLLRMLDDVLDRIALAAASALQVALR